MVRNWRLCSQIVGYLQHSGVLGRPYIPAWPQYSIHLCARGLGEGKCGGFKMAWPSYITRMYTSHPKGGKDSTHKPNDITKTVETDVTCKDIQATRKESVEKKAFSEYKSPSSEGQRDVHKVIPSKQEHDRLHRTTNSPQQALPNDMNDKQKRYREKLIGGVLLFLATAIAAYYASFIVKKDKEGKPGEVQKTVQKSKRNRNVFKFPAESKDIPQSVPYLLIGGGTASFAAFRAIKSADPTAKVLVIDNEGYYPYMRPPLSKEMWFNDDVESNKKLKFKQWNGSERSLFYEPEDFYVDCTKLITHPNGGVAVARGWTVKRIDAFERKAVLDDGFEISYEKCLIATGSTAMNLPLFEEAAEDIKDKVTLFRGISDFEELEAVIKSGSKSIAIIGGGFLGSELACALARSHKTDVKVYQIFQEPGNMDKVLPGYLSLWTTNMVQEEGVNVIANAEVENVEKVKDQLVLSLNNGRKIMADHVIVAVGASPNTGLAGPSGLEVDEEIGGFLVNAELMARSNLWSAGDCTCFYDVKLGRRRVEHHDHAVVSGRLAGENMTGAGKPYWHQSMFWSDLGPNVGYEAIGIIDSTLPTVGVFAKATDKDMPKAVVEATDEGNQAKMEEDEQPVSAASHCSESSKHGEDYGKGVIFYLRNDIIVGIVMWNLFNRMPVARKVLKEEKKYSDLNEVAKLFNIHEE